jgi:RNA-directed DNA polymerase
VPALIADPNRTLCRWFGYFKHAHPGTFIVIDKVHPQTAPLVSAQTEEAAGLRILSGRSSRLARRVLRSSRLLALDAAWQTARHR